MSAFHLFLMCFLALHIFHRPSYSISSIPISVLYVSTVMLWKPTEQPGPVTRSKFISLST